MNPAKLKIALVFLAIGTGIALLAVESSRSATVYYQTLPEYLAAPAGHSAVRITGYVAPGSIVRKPGEPVRFVMHDADHKVRMAVSYDDLVPDTFKDGAEVVVEGHRRADQVFDASTLLAKCPSKYEADGKAKDVASAGAARSGARL